MKRLFIAIIIVFLYSETDAQLLIGPKIGLQGVSVHYQNINDYSDSIKSFFKPGFNLGSVVNYKVNEKFSLQFELNYSLRGKHLQTIHEEKITHKSNYHFIESPALLRYSFKKQKIKYFINAGPSLSYWLGGNGKISSPSLLEAGERPIKYGIAYKEVDDESGKLSFREVNRFQIGLDFGLGVQFPVKRGQNVMLEARYNAGHSNYGKKNSVKNLVPGYNDNLEAANQSFNISAAYVFDYAIHGWKRGKTTTVK